MQTLFHSPDINKIMTNIPTIWCWYITGIVLALLDSLGILHMHIHFCYVNLWCERARKLQMRDYLCYLHFEFLITTILMRASAIHPD